jgi:hypothetical protein
MKKFMERCETCAAYRERVLNVSFALLMAVGVAVVIAAIVDVSLNGSSKSTRSACRNAHAECKSGASSISSTDSSSI